MCKNHSGHGSNSLNKFRRENSTYPAYYVAKKQQNSDLVEINVESLFEVKWKEWFCNKGPTKSVKSEQYAEHHYSWEVFWIDSCKVKNHSLFGSFRLNSSWIINAGVTGKHYQSEQSIEIEKKICSLELCPWVIFLDQICK